jgi:photosystem II stability/assembly factor-like uncharacterized protein
MGMRTSTPSWRTPRACRRLTGTGVAALAAAALGSASVAAATPRPTPPAPPSAIGGSFVSWLAVSPAYMKSGVVAAIGVVLNCDQDCIALWVSRDGGSTWHRAAAKGWQPSRVVIAMDAQGHDILYGTGSKLLMRSDDLGETFVAAGGGGMPTMLPSYPQDGSFAVASVGLGSDYVVRHGAAHDVAGSTDADTDLEFVASPEYPNGGSSSPALLVGMDPISKSPVVLHCTVDFACSSPTTLVQPETSSTITTTNTLLFMSGDYAEHGSVFADTPIGVQKSTDGGMTFTPLSIVSTAGADRTATPMMALATGYREAGPVRTAYVSVFQVSGVQTKQPHTDGGVYKTDDGGSHWTALATTGPFAGGSQAIAIAPDGRLFASYTDHSNNSGLLCSADGGASWHAACPPVGNRAPAIGSGSAKPAGAGCNTATCGNNLQSAPSNGTTQVGTSGQTKSDLTPVGAAQTSPSAGPRSWVIPAVVAVSLLVAALVGSVVRGVRRRATRRTLP